MNLDTITLTQGQEEALTQFNAFILNPNQKVFVLEGYSGCGKTTLVRKLLDGIPDLLKTAKLLNPSFPSYCVELTATTGKAAENLNKLTGQPAKTIHSHLGLRVWTDYKTGETTLKTSKNAIPKEWEILFIDEASYVSKQLLFYINKLTGSTTKIIFVGDPAQLIDIKSTEAPVFQGNYPRAKLTEVVRQAEGNPIVDLSTKFRQTVETGEFFSFKPDGNNVIYLGKQEFMEAIEVEFSRPDWKYHDSKILSWSNASVISYNKFVREFVKGDANLQEGDYAICNSFITVDRKTIKTDQLVYISEIHPTTLNHDVSGNFVDIDGITVFHPHDWKQAAARAKQARDEGNFDLALMIEQQWVDLRAAYAQTVHKSQGSTYDKVFIDLNDIRRCTSGDQIARMLYVGVSRARNQVYLTGDLV